MNRHSTQGPAAVAAGHSDTADAAAEVLAAGGTAADAAVAAAFAAMVAEPVLAGMMGGGFAMVRRPDGRADLLDFFVQTPRQRRAPGGLDLREIHADFGTTRQAFHIGAGTIAAAGVGPGLAELHARLGRMPMTALVEPACRLARDGVTVTRFQATLGQIITPILTATPASRALFCEQDVPRPAGAVARNPDLAEVLDEFAREGPRFIQVGEVAAAVLALTVDGGHLGPEDLAEYRPEWRVPLSVTRAGVRIALNPPPSLGGALIGFALQLLERGPRPVEVAAALAATVRARIEADLDRDPAAGLARLLDPDLLGRYRRDLRGRAAASRGTTQISVMDGSGLGVSLTLSNGEGCGLVAPGTGIMPNNMLGEEDLLPDGLEAWTPDRRLASMMAPLAADWPDGRCLLLGSGGSNRIRSALVQVLLAVIDRGADLADAVTAPRLHAEGVGEVRLDYEEEGLAAADRAALLADWPEACGWDRPSMFFGGAHGVMREPGGGLRAAGDPRRDGCARIM